MLSDIAENLGNVYFRLGMLLNVGSAFIKQVEYNHHRDLTRITFEVLVRWRNKARERADTLGMAEELINALRALHQNVVADKVRYGECF